MQNTLEKTAPLSPRFAAVMRPANQNLGRDLAAQVNAELDLVALFEAFREWYHE